MGNEDAKRIIKLANEENVLLGKINDNLKLLVMCAGVAVCFSVWVLGRAL